MKQSNKPSLRSTIEQILEDLDNDLSLHAYDIEPELAHQKATDAILKAISDRLPEVVDEPFAGMGTPEPQRQVLRNCVYPEVGKAILDAWLPKYVKPFEWVSGTTGRNIEWSKDNKGESNGVNN